MLTKVFSLFFVLLWSTSILSCESPSFVSLDPDAIRRILLEHLPQFRYCYQKEVEGKSINSNVSLKFNFLIESSGLPSRNQIITEMDLPPSFTRCLSGVLRDINFPKPFGNGTTEVNQPFNFLLKEL